jgi:hypothetical protein
VVVSVDHSLTIARAVWGRIPLGMNLGENRTNPVLEPDDTAYNLWLSQMVAQMFVMNSVFPKGHVPGSIPMLLMGIAKAQLDGHELSVSDIVGHARRCEPTGLRYIAMLEKYDWICRSPADPERCRLTPSGDALIRKMWQRSRYIYE